MTKPNKQDLRRRRDAAVSFEIDCAKGDSIQHLWSTVDGLPVVSKRRICRVRSPDAIDPGMAHDEVPWQQSVLFESGTEDPLVARTLVQVNQFLDRNFSKSDVTRAGIFDVTFRVMRSLLSLERTLQRIENEIRKRVELVSKDLARHTEGQSPKPIAPIETLESDFKFFALEVRQCLNCITELFELTLAVPVEPGRYDKARRALKEKFGEDLIVHRMLEGDARWIELWIDLANTIKHPTPNERVIVNDLTLLPNRQIRLPTWQLRHPRHDLDRPQALLDACRPCVTNLLGLFEDLFISLFEAVLRELPPGFSWEIASIDQKDRNPSAPVRYVLSTKKALLLPMDTP